MALIKNNATATAIPTSTINPAVVGQGPVTDAPWEEVQPEQATAVYQQAAPVYEQQTAPVYEQQAAQAPVDQTAYAHQQSTVQAGYPQPQAPAQAIAPAAPAAAAMSSAALASLANQGFEGLGFDWTSFPTISLRTEGIFQDIDNRDYGKEFHCRIQGSKPRWVYRANPVLDNKRDVAFSYDRVKTQNGILLQDKFKEWEAQGKMIDEREYLEVLVEMVAPGEVYDGEYRILQISPTSRGRFSGHVAKATVIGDGHPGNVVTKVLVGPKVTKVQNPFYPWAFEVVKD